MGIWKACMGTLFCDKILANQDGGGGFVAIVMDPG